MRKTKRANYLVAFCGTYPGISDTIQATSYGNAVAKFRRKHGTPHLGSERDGSFTEYAVETPADRK